jgi:hypothetical protein
LVDEIDAREDTTQAFDEVVELKFEGAGAKSNVIHAE